MFLCVQKLVVNNIQILRSYLDAESALHDSISGALPLEFIDKFIMFIDLYLLDSKETKYEQQPAYSEFINYLTHEIHNMKMSTEKFIKANSKKQNKDVDDFLNNIMTFYDLEETRFISGEDETTIKKIDFMRNIIRLLYDVFPNIITNSINPCSSNCKIPKHWKLSEFHNKDMVNILNSFYIDFIKHFNNESVKQILETTQKINKIIYKLSTCTMYLSNSNDPGSMLFNKDICFLLYKFLYYVYLQT